MSDLLESSQTGAPRETDGPGIVASAPVTITTQPKPAEGAGVTAQHCGCGVQPSAPLNGSAVRSNIYAIGSVGFDFVTEARRDTYRQLMPRVDPATGRPPVIGEGPATTVPPNPHDAIQLVNYLDGTPSESTKLIWTLNLELTPIYAIEAELPYAEDVYKLLRAALRGESLPDTDPNFVSRVSIGGFLSGRTVRLFSGQILPVVVAQPRGLFTWNEPALLSAVIDAVTAQVPTDDVERYTEAARTSLRNFIDKVYYLLRNLGQSSPDRALNFAATNAFQAASGILRAIFPEKTGLVVGVPGSTGIFTLDSIEVSKSPFCRLDSDCWDVRITFFDPENDRRARIVLQFTIDVYDEMPVSLGPTRFFTMSYR